MMYSEPLLREGGPGEPRGGIRGPRSRWLDPVSYARSVSPLSYVGADPVNWTDPSGLAGASAGSTYYVCGNGGGQHEPCDEFVPDLRLTNERSGGGGTGAGGGPGETITITGRRCDGISVNGNCVSAEDLLVGGITVGGIIFDVVTGPSGEGAVIAAAAPRIARGVLKPKKVTVKYARPTSPKPPKTKAETRDLREKHRREYYDNQNARGLGDRYNSKNDPYGGKKDLMSTIQDILESLGEIF